MSVKPFFRDPEKVAPRPQNRDRKDSAPPDNREPWPDEQRDELTNWEREQIATDRAERIRLEKERAAEAARVVDRVLDVETERFTDEFIDQKISDLLESDTAKLDRLARGTLRNQGLMGAMKLPANSTALMRARREVMRDLYSHGQSLDDVNEYE